MIYTLQLSPKAEQDIAKLKRNTPNAYKKVAKLLSELQLHPTTGTGKPELLKHDRLGQWSRRIDREHRLVYEVHEDRVLVVVISAHGHYK
ncbi:MAG: Txe/YoeB family addiction module toxin [Mangrovibacterium sp.]